MKPNSLQTLKLGNPLSRKERFAALGPIAARHGMFPKGTVLPETTTLACPRVRVDDFPEDFLPPRMFERLERNQTLASCCRHPENHEIEAMKSHPLEEAPDIYVLHCTCGRQHRSLWVGSGERPSWGAA